MIQENTASSSPRKIPREGALDSTIPFLRDPYDFISRRCRAHQTELFETRIQFEKTICMSGEEAVFMGVWVLPNANSLDVIRGVREQLAVLQDELPTLESIKSLHQLKILNLGSTKVSDAGLVHLRELTQLEELSLWSTKVTMEAKNRLRKAFPNCVIR